MVHRLFVLRWRLGIKAALQAIWWVEQLFAMPLETVPDLFDDTTHNELDRAVEKAVEDDLADVSDLTSNLQYFAVLYAIVARGKDMNTKYLDMIEAKNLITTHEELRAMLASAWRRKSFREIRNLGACLRFVPVIYSSTSRYLIR